MKCPYCGIENPEDAQECSNCSADLASLPKGTPPPESTSPTMMSSAAEIAAMLAAAQAGKETPTEMSPEPEAPVVPLADYSAPTMMTSSTEVAAMLAATKAEADFVPEVEEPVVEETPVEEVPEEFAYAPTMVTAVPAEVAAFIAATQAVESSEETPAEETSAPWEPEAEEVPAPPMAYDATMISETPVEVTAAIAAARFGQTADEEEPLPTPPTLVGIPDPLGIEAEEPFPVPLEPAPTFTEPPAPSAPEPVEFHAPSASTPAPSEEPPVKDNRTLWIIGGVLIFVFVCCCMCLPLVTLLLNFQAQ